MTYTVALLEVSEQTYVEIEQKLKEAGYEDVFFNGKIDMNGLALVKQQPSAVPVAQRLERSVVARKVVDSNSTGHPTLKGRLIMIQVFSLGIGPRTPVGPPSHMKDVVPCKPGL